MFTNGFEKTASFGRAMKSVGKATLHSSVARNAAIGAATGGAAGAAADSQDRVGGAVKGALTGGILGGAGTAGYRGYKVNKRFSGSTGNITKKHMAGKADRLKAKSTPQAAAALGGNIYEGT
jgi:hypothetical protein